MSCHRLPYEQENHRPHCSASQASDDKEEQQDHSDHEDLGDEVAVIVEHGENVVPASSNVLSSHLSLDVDGKCSERHLQ